MTATCDTSVLIAVLAPWHPEHERTREVVRDVTAIGAHVLLESYSVLTRLPHGRLDAVTASDALAALPWGIIDLMPKARESLVPQLARAGVIGGAVYDGLVGMTAAAHGLTLLTRDRRARRTYDALGVAYTTL
ncbi:PIN domain-containing protein [Microbacterium sp. KUDC0406]|uniref:PIN domain-containing protein n=1 Tax=Microbacterium sp. KUDC0406 TaxID=2909588 RepID=UPI001F305021|nr:PIN domain-containing protein [Microbacterium sp. KUDC0406]UJP10894.1 PIN domain-containing protein [Microbacterium sp. KUDC0406]